MVIHTGRKLPLQGVTNLRDIGGYETTDGRNVKWGCLFRSDELSNLTEHDKLYLQEMGLQLIVDLRSSEERIGKPNPVIEDIQDIHLPVFDEEGHNGNTMDMVVELMKNKQASNLLIDFNKEFVTNKMALHAYEQLMNYIVEMDKLVILWHCAAGKDRTGLAAAIVLLALGVAEETVIEDYLLTNQYREEFNEALIQQARQKISDEKALAGLRTLLTVDKLYLQAAIDEMKKQYGSIDNFLKEALNISDEKRKILQDKFLE